MSTTETVLRLAVGLLLVLGNAFFVVTEFALTRLRQLDPARIQEDSRLREAWRMTERLEIYLTSCQVGITTTSILLGVVAEPAVTWLVRPAAEAMKVPDRFLPAVSIALAVLLINLAHTIWGEQAPTYLGVERPELVARWTARLLRLWTRAIYPLIWAGDGLSKASLRLLGVHMRRSWIEPGPEKEERRRVGYPELRRQMGEILAQGQLSRERRGEILKALAIDEIPVRDIMVPREDIVALSSESSFAENEAILAQRHHTRLPLIRSNLEDCLGIVYVPALVPRIDALRSGELDLGDVAAPKMTVRADTKVSRLIDLFQEARQELALVTEEDGRVVGLVTVTDAFEEIAGELEDPFD